MDKSAVVGDIPLKAPWEAWRGATGSPLGSAAVVYGLGALATYAAWPFLAGQAGAAVRGLGGDTKEDREDAEEFEDNLRSNRLRASLLLPFLPAGLHLAGAMDFSGTRPNLGLTSWDGVKKQASSWDFDYNAGQGSGDQTFNAMMRMPTIPLDHSRGLIQNDPVLDAIQKGKVYNVFDNAPPPNQAGFLTPRDLAVGAIRAGAGYLAGNMAGKAMGWLFGLPKPVTSKLSVGGGIGGALINMGVV